MCGYTNTVLVREATTQGFSSSKETVRLGAFERSSQDSSTNLEPVGKRTQRDVPRIQDRRWGVVVCVIRDDMMPRLELLEANTIETIKNHYFQNRFFGFGNELSPLAEAF